MTTLHILSAGAALGLVQSLQAGFESSTGTTVQARFGAVGAIREALLEGAPCDLIILTEALIDTLVRDGRARGETRASLGRVRTGLAVRAGTPPPDVSTPETLAAALQDADALYFPDPERATAGIHFARVMRELGLEAALKPRWRTWPNGATAMRELAASTSPRALGCTQVTEIRYTPGVALAGLLPPAFELTTTYTAAVTAQAVEPLLARRFIEQLSGPASVALRRSGGFEDDPR